MVTLLPIESGSTLIAYLSLSLSAQLYNKSQITVVSCPLAAAPPPSPWGVGLLNGPQNVSGAYHVKDVLMGQSDVESTLKRISSRRINCNNFISKQEKRTQPATQLKPAESEAAGQAARLSVCVCVCFER